MCEVEWGQTGKGHSASHSLLLPFNHFRGQKEIIEDRGKLEQRASRQQGRAGWPQVTPQVPDRKSRSRTMEGFSVRVRTAYTELYCCVSLTGQVGNILIYRFVTLTWHNLFNSLHHLEFTLHHHFSCMNICETKQVQAKVILSFILSQGAQSFALELKFEKSHPFFFFTCTEHLYFIIKTTNMMLRIKHSISWK